MDHGNIASIINDRLGHINLIHSHWKSGNVTSALSTLHMISNPAVTMDIFNTTFAHGIDMDNITLSHISPITILALDLITSKYENYIKVGIRTIQNLIKKFGDEIKQVLNMPLFGGVDLVREERINKVKGCLEQLKLVMENPAIKRIINDQNELGKLTMNLMTNLDYLVKSCNHN